MNEIEIKKLFLKIQKRISQSYDHVYNCNESLLSLFLNIQGQIRDIEFELLYPKKEACGKGLDTYGGNEPPEQIRCQGGRE